MANNDVLSKNLDALGQRNAPLAAELGRTSSNGFYACVRLSRDGRPVPQYASGSAAHSLYNPQAESERSAGLIPRDAFPLFTGLGAGYAVRSFFARFPEASCAAAELDRETLVSLLSLVDLSDILEDPRFTLIPALTEEDLRRGLSLSYLPALHGGFYVVPPNPQWLSPEDTRFKELDGRIQDILRGISADYSVQAHFGRLWNRNFWLNLRIASTGCALPAADTAKTALIAAAGPGLESRIGQILESRSSWCIIATDTAYSALAKHGIAADYFVSIDGQRISSMHADGTFLPGTKVILELCGNAELGSLARRCGVPVYYFAGEHPLSRIASAWCGIPRVRTGSGTVTLAARDIAYHLGFKEEEFAGADFRYARGKPYARGTYLAELYGSGAMRTSPAETQYAALMFRSPVRCLPNQDGTCDYRTAILDSYADSFRRWTPPSASAIDPIRPFAYAEVRNRYIGKLKDLNGRIATDDPVAVSLLPFLAWYRMRNAPNAAAAIELALTLIEGYTTKP